MKTNKREPKKILFPENREIKKKLLTGDRARIAEKSGLSEFTVRDIFNGYRRLTDDVAQAFISLMEERDALRKKVTQIINN